MLLRTFFMIFILSVLMLTMLGTTELLGKTVLYERALVYVPAVYQEALAAVGQSFQAGGGTYVSQSAPAPACISNDAPCSFFASRIIEVPSQSPPQAAHTCGLTLTNCAVMMQEQVIGEGRLGLRITLTVYDAAKVPIVSRTKFLTLRTFGVDPYFAVIGERDGATGDRAAAPEGENAGLAASATQAGTQIQVQYHDTTGANDDSEHDTWSTQGWSSGNADGSNWSH